MAKKTDHGGSMWLGRRIRVRSADDSRTIRSQQLEVVDTRCHMFLPSCTVNQAETNMFTKIIYVLLIYF